MRGTTTNSWYLCNRHERLLSKLLLRFVLMDKHLKYLVALLVVVLFTCLTGGLQLECGHLFSTSCQSWKTGREMTGLVAAALVAFVMASIFAALFILKKNRWASICEFIALAAGAVLMLAAVAVYYNRSSILSPLMATITMTLSIEIAVVLSLDGVAYGLCWGPQSFFTLVIHVLLYHCEFQQLQGRLGVLHW
ncbi:hypothetical protein EGR_01195 [Echinococcus granulosus]|uniref:Uncharacterized protein n=1 Tax=Echinococcus granulosus TaxID=6210 RepID=W6UZT4_ECHGR|nr:hypothetical protein EGR_01195 [Echinococcus granulosus]EUB64067.1 hypothetical protein EGR_01195 [Echinococcus granulosus]